MDEKLKVTEVDNNKIKQKMKLQEEKTLEMNNKLICIIKENELLLLDNIFMDKKLSQSNKEAEKLRDEISFLQRRLMSVVKENEQLLLENVLMDKKLRQSGKEGKKLRGEINFLQQKMQPCQQPVQIKHNITVGEMTESRNVWLCSKPRDVEVQ
jgi:hypothetical protein